MANHAESVPAVNSETKDLENTTKNRKIKRILRNWPACLHCGEPVRNMGKRFCHTHATWANVAVYKGKDPKLINVTEYEDNGV